MASTTSTRPIVGVCVLGLTDEEAEQQRLRDAERLMQSEAERREESDRVAAEEALMKARRQQEWVGLAVSLSALGL